MIHSDDPGTARLVELRDVEARGAATERAVERWSVRARAGHPLPSLCKKELAVVADNCTAAARRERRVDVGGCVAPVGLSVRKGQTGIGGGLADRVTAGEPRAREVRDAPKNGLVLGDIGHLANAAEPATRDLDSCHARGRHDARDRRGTGKSRQTQVPVHGSAGTSPSLTEPAAGKSGGERDGRLERPRSG